MLNYQNIACNLAGTQLKIKSMFGRIPFDITPIV